MKYSKWHGIGHTAREPEPGELALFCPACPQPGVNLPLNPTEISPYDRHVHIRRLMEDHTDPVTAPLIQEQMAAQSELRDGRSFLSRASQNEEP